MSREFRRMRTTKIYQGGVCPSCGAPATALSSFEGERPDPGDPVVCLECGAYLEVIATDLPGRLTVSVLSPEALLAMPLDLRLRLAQFRRAVQAIPRER